jgi:hypothetical protein
MDRDLRHRIYDVADAVWQQYWETIPTPFHCHYDSWSGPIDEIGERAVELYRQTVRDKCAEAGVNERDYWLAAPQEALIMRPACLADELDRIEADLDAARKQAALSVPY